MNHFSPSVLLFCSVSFEQILSAHLLFLEGYQTVLELPQRATW